MFCTKPYLIYLFSKKFTCIKYLSKKLTYDIKESNEIKSIFLKLRKKDKSSFRGRAKYSLKSIVIDRKGAIERVRSSQDWTKKCSYQWKSIKGDRGKVCRATREEREREPTSKIWFSSPSPLETVTALITELSIVSDVRSSGSQRCRERAGVAPTFRPDDGFLLSSGWRRVFYLPIVKNGRSSETIGINGSTRHTADGHEPF